MSPADWLQAWLTAVLILVIGCGTVIVPLVIGVYVLDLRDRWRRSRRMRLRSDRF